MLSMLQPEQQLVCTLALVPVDTLLEFLEESGHSSIVPVLLLSQQTRQASLQEHALLRVTEAI
jgi:hypothetical protein